MLTNLFSWLRSSVRDAVLNGVDDALNILDGGSRDTATPQLDALRSRLTVALPAPSSVPTEAPGKAQDATGSETAQEPTPTRNSRRKATPATV
jgi:hypothetical protein